MQQKHSQRSPRSTLTFSRRLFLERLAGRSSRCFTLTRTTASICVRSRGLSKVVRGCVQRELQRLTDAQIIRRTIRGRTAFYQANRDCPIFPELQSLVLKTAGVVEVLRAALAPLADRIQVAFVYGSVARNEPKAGSDIDLFVVGPVSFGDVAETLSEAQSRLAREVNPTVYDVADFQRQLTRNEHFVTAVVQQPKLFVIGSDHELDQLGSPPAGSSSIRRPRKKYATFSPSPIAT